MEPNTSWTTDSLEAVQGVPWLCRAPILLSCSWSRLQMRLCPSLRTPLHRTSQTRILISSSNWFVRSFQVFRLNICMHLLPLFWISYAPPPTSFSESWPSKYFLKNANYEAPHCLILSSLLLFPHSQIRIFISKPFIVREAEIHTHMNHIKLLSCNILVFAPVDRRQQSLPTEIASSDVSTLQSIPGFSTRSIVSFEN